MTSSSAIEEQVFTMGKHSEKRESFPPSERAKHRRGFRRDRSRRNGRMTGIRRFGPRLGWLVLPALGGRRRRRPLGFWLGVAAEIEVTHDFLHERTRHRLGLSGE